MNALEEAFRRDRSVWDDCAAIYENRIVRGHPDVLAYEAFEEDLLDRILLYLARECGRTIFLYDVGCGSGRLHLRYGMKVADAESLVSSDRKRVRALRQFSPEYEFDPLLAERLQSVGGIDFSKRMLEAAEEKLRESGLGSLLGKSLTLEHGSAFDIQDMKGHHLPVVVSVCNSVGVMQGPEGASELFKSVRRAVEAAGGVAIISGYRQEALATIGLGNYESTLDVCGQPRWLIPDTYASAEYRQVPCSYKRAYAQDPTVKVDVYDSGLKLIKAGHELVRDAAVVQKTLETGHILTHTKYESHWYPFRQFDDWISAHWPIRDTYHIAARRIDALRGDPAQLAILDAGRLLSGLLERWDCLGEE